MKNYQAKVYLIIMIIIAVFAVAKTTTNAEPTYLNEIMLASIASTADPLWSNDVFASTYDTERISNLGLWNTIVRFHNLYLSNYQRVCAGNCNTNIGAAFRQTLDQGFRQDSFLQAKPFNATFISNVLQAVYFCFAVTPENQLATGFYISTPNSPSSRIWANPNLASSNLFAHTIIHELGHALGLGETLADLKTEIFFGQNSSLRPADNLAYSSTFDRMLLSAVGANRFWAAAYHSNAAFGALWDEVFADIITHRQLEIVRGVVFAGIFDPSVESAFKTSANLTLAQASVLIYEDFVSLADSTLNTSQRYDTLNHLRGWINFYVSFANQNALAASYSVHDWIIDNHRTRFK